MSYSSSTLAAEDYGLAAFARAEERASFIRKTYLHLAGAVGLFALLETLLLSTPIAEDLTRTMFSGRWAWLVVLGLFIGVNMLANKWAHSSTSVGLQYLGLGLTVLAWTVIFCPLLLIATMISEQTGKDIIPTAGIITLALFAALTAIVFVTGKDFSFLRSALVYGGFIIMGLIVASIVIGFSLGMIFTVGLIAFAGAYILYDTSNVLHHYRTEQHVAASLALFSSLALLFWYVIQLVMSLSSRD